MSMDSLGAGVTCDKGTAWTCWTQEDETRHRCTGTWCVGRLWLGHEVTCEGCHKWWVTGADKDEWPGAMGTRHTRDTGLRAWCGHTCDKGTASGQNA